MRALFVIHGPVYGGAHNELAVLAEGLRARGWEPSALLTDEPGTGGQRLRDAGVTVHTMPLHRLRATTDPRPHLALAAGFEPEVRAIRRLLRRERIDVVQAHSVINPHAALAGHRAGVAVCWHLLDMNAPAPLRRLLSPVVARLSDSVTAVGGAVVAAHPGVERLGERLVLTAPPVDLARFAPAPGARERARAELGIPADAFAVVSVGNLLPNKGQLRLVEAARALGEVHVRLLGSRSGAHPAYAAEVEQAIAAAALGDRVRTADPGRRVPELLPAFDALALPSDSEGMPTVVLEAMAAGLAVVASDVGAVRELVEPGRNGLLTPAGDAAALTAALRRLQDDVALRAGMGAAGRERAERGFGLQRSLDDRVRAYELALAFRRARASS